MARLARMVIPGVPLRNGVRQLARTISLVTAPRNGL